MSINLDEATSQLRQQLLQGVYPPGVKLREMTVAETIGVSRTIARLAMSALEHEGLLVREPNRGSRTRAFSIDEIADAIEVRGELEAMAVRLAAERGLDASGQMQIERALEIAERLLEGEIATEDERTVWVQMNEEFHEAIVKASQNWAISVSIGQISNLPLVGTSAIIFDRNDLSEGWKQLMGSHNDHVAIYQAVLQRQGHRAEALMREHAYKNAQNKRRNLREPEMMAHARTMPGGALILTQDKRVMSRQKKQRQMGVIAS